MTDFDRLARLGDAKSAKPSKASPKGERRLAKAKGGEPKASPKGELRLAKTKDGAAFAIGLVEARAARLLDAAYGYALAEARRGRRGRRGFSTLAAPYAARLRSERVGDVDELDRLRVGARGFEGVGRAHRSATKALVYRRLLPAS